MSKELEALEELFKTTYFGSKEEYDKINNCYNNLKQALLKAQEQEKVLEIIKKKDVIVGWFTKKRESNKYFTLETYNAFMSIDRQLTQEEFDLLKRWVE